MKRIRIGHIGTLHDHSQGKLECLKAYPDIFKIIGIVPESDEQYNKIKDIGTYKDIPRMSEDELFEKGVDAVIVESHEFELVNAAQRWIDRGIPVHMDKPAGDDIVKFEKLLSSAKIKKTLQLAYMYRYNPEVIKILRLIKEGRLGEIYSVEAQMNCDHPAEKRQWLWQFKGGMMFYLGCHLIDLIVLLQAVPNEVIPLNTKTGIDGVDAEDFGMAILKYDNGVSFAKACSAEICGFARRQLVVCGSKGTVELKPFELFDENWQTYTESVTVFKDEQIDWTKTGEKKRSESFGRYDAMMLDFAKMVRGEKENPFSYEHELTSHKVILASCGFDIDYKNQ